MRERLIELLQEASTEAGNHIRETTKKVLAEKGRFNSRDDIDRRNIYEIEADYLLANGVIVPPCKVGDKTFLLLEKCIGGYDIVESECVRITDNGNCKYFSMAFDCVEIGNTLEFDIFDFGKTVLLTK